ncbi:ABC transporter permease [Gordonia jinhuaensis]|uniref:Peptide ABC transporter n=1 Tax=Gordonia jinhuaensis TaxID=1517702 RepID=A0A916TDI0_9ACTN|nr:ABC transporter permease [Gordonia jinhuaensis]GGB38487.1 peptide ABC transporter [Gordonia jinhuaensis]
MLMLFTKRLLLVLATLLLASAVVFGLLSVVPGDPAKTMLGVTATPQAVADLRHELGLDRSVTTRYFSWLGGLFHGDFGQSYVTRRSVGPDVMSHLQVSLILVIAAMLVALIVAIPSGTYAAYRSRHVDGALVGLTSQLGIAIPGFLAGLLLVVVFAVKLRWLPASGWAAPIDGAGPFLSHLVLPALALGLVQGAILSRYMRSAVLDVMHEDYMRTARAKGLSPLQTLLRHGMRNAAISVLTISAIELAALLVGAIVIENVFVIPGLGTLLVRSVENRDMVSVQAIVMVIVVAVLAINLLVELLYLLIDPRLRSER